MSRVSKCVVSSPSSWAVPAVWPGADASYVWNDDRHTTGTASGTSTSVGRSSPSTRPRSSQTTCSTSSPPTARSWGARAWLCRPSWP
jgi:hypothetical protein